MVWFIKHILLSIVALLLVWNFIVFHMGVISKLKGEEDFCDLPERNIEMVIPAFRWGCLAGERAAGK